jgi:hypothetical protein
MARATPCATTGVAADVAAAGLSLELDGAAVEFDGDEQPARISDAQAAMPKVARHAADRVETWFMASPFKDG